RSIYLVQPLEVTSGPNAAGHRFVGGQSHVRQLRLRVGAPGNDKRGRLLAAQEERVLNHQSRHGVRGMRKLVSRADVAGGKDAAVGCSQMIIDFDSLDTV